MISTFGRAAIEQARPTQKGEFPKNVNCFGVYHNTTLRHLRISPLVDISREHFLNSNLCVLKCTVIMDSASLSEERVRQLERELDSLRTYLGEKENAVVKAAELGKALLRENEALEERLSEVNKESTQKIEV